MLNTDAKIKVCFPLLTDLSADTDNSEKEKHSHVKPLLVVIFASLFFMLCVLAFLYKFRVLPRIKSSYKQLTRSSNKTVCHNAAKLNTLYTHYT